jgi:hypothetical protein
MLLQDLRQRKIQGVLAHQADILRAYVEKHDKVGDIALQLPTGSGKTLVGLLIAEWRRRKYREKVVYLCPTNQLVHQVVDQATRHYGLRVAGFTGKKDKYDRSLASEYLNADIVAVTNYSSLFNVNPYFSDAEVLILDDAHSSENYISKYWSLVIRRENPAEPREVQAFSAVHSILQKVMPLADAAKMTVAKGTDDWNDRWVDKIPTPRLHEVQAEFASALDEYTDKTEMHYAWSVLRDHLDACHVYVSAQEILIRPLVPPTVTHRPFSRAKQRVYMSATLGAGGDLERVTGVRQIERLQPPLGWDKQGIGRRFFLLPHKSLDDQQTHDLAVAAVKLAKRGLYLVPDGGAERRAKGRFVQSHVAVFDADQLERSKAPFTSATDAVAVIANRYDGIDLVGDECRLLIIEGLPRGANLQERFFMRKIGASILLEDRVLTRVVQGFGRCTRSPNDYAAVIIVGEKLHKYLLNRENRAFLHPEIQAEIEFGIDQSDLRGEEFLENLRHFLAQDAEWKCADDDIIERRTSLVQKDLPATAQLRSTVADEVEYVQAMWSGDYLEALARCRQVLTRLTESDLRGYRAMWLYLAGSAAWLATRNLGSDLGNVANTYFAQAKNAAPSLRWLTGMNVPTPLEEAVPSAPRSSAATLVEGIEDIFEEVGTVQDRKYDAIEKEVRSGIAQDDDGKLFEKSHETLGSLLGYAVGKVEASGTPDPWWMTGQYCFVFEDYSEAKSGSTLSVNKARQAAGHPRWIKEHLKLTAEMRIIAVLITDAENIDANAIPHVRDVQLWKLSNFRTWAENAMRTIRDLRRSYPGEGNLAWQAEACARLDAEAMSPEGLIKSFDGVVAEQLVPKGGRPPT